MTKHEKRKPGALPLWQRDRERLLQNACNQIENLVTAGATVQRAMRLVARRFRNRQYRNDPSKSIRLSASRLTSIFYTWRRSGGKASAFRLNYRNSERRELPGKVRKAFLLACVSDAKSTLDAVRRVVGLTTSGISTQALHSRVRRWLRPGNRKQIVAHLRARQQWLRRERAFQRMIDTFDQ